MSNYKIRVRIDVLDADGDVVDYRGLPVSVLKNATPLQTEQVFKEFETVERAHASMNDLHSAVYKIKALAA